MAVTILPGIDLAPPARAMTEAKIKVAFLEDDADTADFLKDMLNDMGLSPIMCIVSPTLCPCLSYEQPVLLILDLEMGKVSGIDTLQQLRADASTRDIPVIMFSGNLHKLRQLLPNYREMGITAVQKPDVAALAAAIRHAITQHGHKSAAP